FLAGLIGAAANVGYMLIGIVGLAFLQRVQETQHLLASLGLPERWVAQLVRNDGWRLLMMLGAVPALLTFFIRIFVPESAKWEEEKRRGRTSHWATRDLLAVLLGSVIACGIIAIWAIQPDSWSPLALWLARIAGTLVGLTLVTIC